MVRVNPDIVFASVIVIGLPLGGVLLGCVFRLLRRQRLSRALLQASVCWYIGGATAGFTSLYLAALSYRLHLWDFPTGDAPPSTALYVTLLTALVAIPILGAIGGAIYGICRASRTSNQALEPTASRSDV